MAVACRKITQTAQSSETSYRKRRKAYFERYFYDWEHFRSLEEFNRKLKEHLAWSNRKTMRTLGRKSPIQLLKEKLSA